MPCQCNARCLLNPLGRTGCYRFIRTSASRLRNESQTLTTPPPRVFQGQYADTSADLAIENGLISFFCFFAARFSISVFAGFFFVSFFLSMPLLIYVSWISSGE